jgi:hypothetical protein
MSKLDTELAEIVVRIKNQLPYNWSLYDVEQFTEQIKALTGQEFYDNFKREFIMDDRVSFNGDMLALVRRAAGIEE